MTRHDEIRRILSVDDDGSATIEPDNTSSGLVLGGIGSWKTTSTALPMIQSMIADRERGQMINDAKNGEIASQIGAMAEQLGRKFGAIDPYNELGDDFPNKITVNELSGLVTAHRRNDPGLSMLVKGVAQTLVPEPDNDQRNFYWREEPRIRIRFAIRFLLERNPALCTLGGLSNFISDTRRFDRFTDIAAEEAEARAVRVLAGQIREMRERNPEHHYQHMGAAISALDLFDEGPLHDAGFDADITHEELLRDKWIVCFVTPARFIEQIGTWSAVHFNTLLGLQLTAKFGRTDFIVDEAPSGPFHPFFRDLNTIRGSGGRILLAGVSRAAFIKRYGERVFAAAEENCRVKQYLQVATVEEAERIVKAAGDEKTISNSVGINSDRNSYSNTINTGKQPRLTIDEILNMPRTHQVLQVTGVGTWICPKVRQNEIAPTCFMLGENHVEGGRLEPDPKVTLPTGLEGDQ
ncbi:type IV secretory system conjugative DNA transfer family protein [Ruegeria sp. HKCCD8929]|uniref:type IV secretory system conjugative DNA transfer family protein n=1 Tax=Ruegeria sp. HKCCD8929 TaxID=2683006 RepID=UPI001488F4E7|nr:TraM recognition domain-containing protein [Ruegeria sp. HKCCD8929]